MAGLAILRDVAEANHGEFVDGDASRILVAVRPVLDSGAVDAPYVLEIVDDGDALVAREAAPDRLPRFCPERHVNPGGTFCLYWEEDEPLGFLTRQDIELWWGKLLIFLRRQTVAGRLRRWPGKGDARAHGQDAARFQRSGEIAAAKFGTMFETALREDRFTVRKIRGSGRRRLRLVLDGKRIATLDEARGQMMTVRSRCRCERSDELRLPLIACGDHAEALADLVGSVRGRVVEERRFFDRLALMRARCCGTMDDCPLADRHDTDAFEAA